MRFCLMTDVTIRLNCFGLTLLQPVRVACVTFRAYL